MCSEKTQIKVIGLVSNWSFQKVKACVEKFNYYWPDKFEKPEIIGLFMFSWDEYLLKCRRKFGGKYYEIKHPVLIYLNGTFLGDSDDYFDKIKENYIFGLPHNYTDLAIEDIKSLILKSKRTYAFVTININNNEFVGTIVFQLYNDILPNTCKNFINLCLKSPGGYSGSYVHRICAGSWIQCGGQWPGKHKGFVAEPIKNKPMICESYCVQHLRRGIIGMCNDGKHRLNSTQFYITLNPTPWMDQLYVAFGQMVEGDRVLQMIENVATNYEAPTKTIRIMDCGLWGQQGKKFTLRGINDPDIYISGDDVIKPISIPSHDILDPRDVSSELEVERYLAGLYCAPSDLVHRYSNRQKEDVAVIELKKCVRDLSYASFMPSQIYLRHTISQNTFLSPRIQAMQSFTDFKNAPAEDTYDNVIGYNDRDSILPANENSEDIFLNPSQEINFYSQDGGLASEFSEISGKKELSGTSVSVNKKSTYDGGATEVVNKVFRSPSEVLGYTVAQKVHSIAGKEISDEELKRNTDRLVTNIINDVNNSKELKND